MARWHGLVGMAGVVRAARREVGLRLVAALLMGLGFADILLAGPDVLGAAALAQPSQATDSDGDGLANDADPDDDNDGVTDVEDPAPFDPTIPGDLLPTQATDSEEFDNDGDGLDNAADPDDENDGVSDIDDPAPFNPSIPGAVAPTQATDTDSEGPDSDGDGLDNASDPDDDNDGIPDVDDPFPLGGSDPPSTDPGTTRSELPVGAVNDASSDGVTGDAPAISGSAPLVTALPSTGEGESPRAALILPLTLILLGLTLGGAASRLRRGLRTED